jgi:uncharacterized damage-inducible protein DinB
VVHHRRAEQLIEPDDHVAQTVCYRDREQGRDWPPRGGKENPMASELERFFETWDREAANTVRLLRALPADQYDFRPDAGGRSLGELAWHLAEGDAYMSYGVERGEFSMGARPPHMDRPRTIEELAPGFERVHGEAAARLKGLRTEDLDRVLTFFHMQVPIRTILWDMIIIHGVHHRGQLSLMCRLAGGVTPGLYGPNREETAALRSQPTA